MSKKTIEQQLILTPQEGELLTELVIADNESPKKAAAGLLSDVEAESPGEAERFDQELARSLEETEAKVRELEESKGKVEGQSWTKARDTVSQFRPVPWFIWRLSNYVFSQPGQVRQVSDGAVIGLRRLLFAAASDQFLGTGRKVNSIHRALEILQPDVVAAVAVVHAVCRRLATAQFERIWRPILDDALLRAQIGFLVGERKEEFGAGRGMLAGFAGRCGLAVLIASGTLDQARRSLELLASGAEINKVGLGVYGCDPLQISAMTLSAAGCGRDAAFGTVRFATPLLGNENTNDEQFYWLSAFTIVERIRTGKHREIKEDHWEALGYHLGQDRGDLTSVSETLVRRGHSLSWIV